MGNDVLLVVRFELVEPTLDDAAKTFLIAGAGDVLDPLRFCDECYWSGRGPECGCDLGVIRDGYFLPDHAAAFTSSMRPLSSQWQR